jgi:hypothetical protein
MTDTYFQLQYIQTSSRNAVNKNTVIIYKFTQGNLGAQKIARSQFQSPVKKKKSQIATLGTDSAIPVFFDIFYRFYVFFPNIQPTYFRKDQDKFNNGSPL